MRVIIHMGLPKTGTSAVQTWLVDRASDLFDHGILMPTNLVGPLGNARLLAAALHEPGPSRSPHQGSLIEGLRSALVTPKATDLLISSEYYEKVMFRPPLIQRSQAALRSVGASWDVGVIFLRNLFDLLNSSYAQNLKVGPYPLDFAGFLAMRREKRVNDFAANVANLRRVGVDVRLAVYGGGGSQTEILMQKAGLRDRLPADFGFETARTNESVGVLGLIAARRFWALVDALIPQSLPKVRGELARLLINAAHSIRDRPYNGFTPELRALTEAHYAAILSAVATDLSAEESRALCMSRSIDLPTSSLQEADLALSDRTVLADLLHRIADGIAASPKLANQVPETFRHHLTG